MEKIKQKKIRKLLICYTNEKNKYSKKLKKFNILINSTSLEELEKKNMKCKEFFIQEKTETYQNIDNRRSIIQNICINNNSYYSNIIIYPLSQRLIYNNIIKDMININLNDGTLNTTTIYDENSSDNKLPQTLRQKTKKNIINQKINNQESPLDHSSLIKKELGERKLKLHKKEINLCSSYNKNFLFFQRDKEFNEEKKNNDNSIKEKENEADKDFDFFISERLSSITLATEVSRIIKVCHNDDNLSTSKISKKKEEREDIKKAKQYAKKLKLYCRTLKNKFSNSSKIKKIPNKIKPLNINGIKLRNKEKDKKFPITDRNGDRNEYLKKDKIKKNHKSKKLNIIFGKSYEKIIKKKQSEKLKENNLLSDNEFVDNNYERNKIVHQSKKMKSERNIKIKINENNYINSEDNNNDCNNLTEQSTFTNNIYNSFKKKNFLKISKKAVKKKYKEEENKSKFITQIESKSPFKKKKKDLILNFVKKIKNKIIDNFHQDNNISKKDSKKKPKLIIRNNDDNNKVIESPSLFKKTKKKRISIKVKMSEKSLIEQIFFKKKNLSTTGQNSLIKKLKKKHLNENIEQDNNKIYKKNNKKNKVELIENEKIAKNKVENEESERIIRLKKTKTQKFKKQRNTFMFSENNFNPNKINLKKKRKMSSLDKDGEIANNTINYLNKKNKKSIFSLKEDNKKIEEDKYNTIEIDDFNKMDDYLYNKKHKKVKIGPK